MSTPEPITVYYASIPSYVPVGDRLVGPFAEMEPALALGTVVEENALRVGGAVFAVRMTRDMTGDLTGQCEIVPLPVVYESDRESLRLASLASMLEAHKKMLGLFFDQVLLAEQGMPEQRHSALLWQALGMSEYEAGLHGLAAARERARTELRRLWDLG